MRLSKAQVQNFRAIVDSGIVDIQDRVTVLIGKNEQGKTTFLKALASANVGATYSPADLPNHMRATLEQREPAEIPVVTLWLTPEPNDKAVAGSLIPSFETIETLKITKFYNASRAIAIIRQNAPDEPLTFKPPDIGPQRDKFRKLAETLKIKIGAHSERHADFKPHFAQAQDLIDGFAKANFESVEQTENLIRTFATGLTSVPGQDAAIQEEFATAIREIEKVQNELRQAFQRDDPQILLERLLPRFIFHSTSTDKIPNEVDIAEFVKNPDATSKGMANLCRVAGLTTSKIQELASVADTATKETFEDYYKANASGGINEYWTQESYQVHFRFGTDKMSVSISDSTYSPRIPPLDRSDGFQWYLSFYAALLSEVSKPQPIVFALDNPGLELHADGQRDIKRFLEEKLPANAQVIYVTHSPAMIDPFNLEQVRRVELKPDQNGTKVSRLAFKEGSDADLLEPVRSAVGASIATSLIMNDFNVLVEGAADKPILEGAFAHFHKDRAGRIVVNGSISESPNSFLVRFYERAKLPFVVYVDADSAGRDIATQLHSGGLSEQRIVSLSKAIAVPQGKDFEIEDIISPDFYHSAVQNAYPENPVEKQGDNQGKRTKHYEKKFRDDYGIGFNKRRVAIQLKRLLVDGASDRETNENLEKLTTALLTALDAQVSKSEPIAATTRPAVAVPDPIRQEGPS